MARQCTPVSSVSVTHDLLVRCEHIRQEHRDIPVCEENRYTSAYMEYR